MWSKREGTGFWLIQEIISGDGSELDLALIHLAMEQNSGLYTKSSGFNFLVTFMCKYSLIISVKTIALLKGGKSKNYASWHIEVFLSQKNGGSLNSQIIR